MNKICRFIRNKRVREKREQRDRLEDTVFLYKAHQIPRNEVQDAMTSYIERWRRDHFFVALERDLDSYEAKTVRSVQFEYWRHKHE